MRSTLLAVLLLSSCASATSSQSSDSGPSPSVGEERTTSATDTTTDAPTDTTDTAGTHDTTTTAQSGNDQPGADPSSVDVMRPEGFERMQAVATAADGTTCELCIWIADTAPQRSRGLMFVTDLGAADAMAFVYPESHTGTFWMKNTVLPLSIAFFSPDGDFLSSFDMEPCTEPDCPSYPTPDDFLVAVEVPQGELAPLGLIAGSTLELLDLPCDP